MGNQACWLVSMFVLLAGCSGSAGEAVAIGPDGAVVPRPDGGPGGEPGGGAGGGACGAPRVQLPVGATQTETCSGTIAARTFDYAVCACNDVHVAGGFRTRSFDSTRGAGSDVFGAPVGTNGLLTAAGLVDVGGTFIAASESDGAGLGAGGTNIHVGGDAFFGGQSSSASSRSRATPGSKAA